MSHPVEPFAHNYAEARTKFLAAATAAGARLESHPHPLPGLEHEALAMDVARLGADDADALLVVSSGCHGVEGACGSAIQVALLDDAAWRARAREAGVALLLVHALNPWGFSHGRRVTHEGVDLNRNVVDFDRPLPRNDGYDELAALLLPEAWPPAAADEQRLMAYAARHGMAALQQAVSGGQYRHPDGLFYGGAAPTWSLRTLRAVLGTHATRCRRLGWIDLHSGLGERGVGERIFAGRADDLAGRERARAWWGEQVTFTGDGSSTSSDLQGNLWALAQQACGQASATALTLEFGTRPLPAVTQALRFDHWVARRAEATDDERAAARRLMREAFFVDAPDWKQAVLAQGHAATLDAIAGLAGWR